MIMKAAFLSATEERPEVVGFHPTAISGDDHQKNNNGTKDEINSGAKITDNHHEAFKF